MHILILWFCQGASAIIVSNHGGRQLDTVPSTIEVLPDVVAAVDNRIPVLLDGGIQRGTDVLKALALGAQGVFLGRPILWGLAVNGEAGVKSVLEMIRDEFKSAMALAGCANLSDITRDLIWNPKKKRCQLPICRLANCNMIIVELTNDTIL